MAWAETIAFGGLSDTTLYVTGRGQRTKLLGRWSGDNYGGGKAPSAISASRSPTRYSSLMWSRATVTRPMAVRPTRYGPSQRKCVAHLWRRGLNSGVILRVFASRLVRSEPLNELQ